MQETNKKNNSSQINSIKSQEDIQMSKETPEGKNTYVTGSLGGKTDKDKCERGGFNRDQMYKTSYGTPVDERENE